MALLCGFDGDLSVFICGCSEVFPCLSLLFFSPYSSIVIQIWSCRGSFEAFGNELADTL